MQRLEQENNRLFIAAYGLQDELSPDVPEDQITLTRADREKDCQRLISYVIGCMMGRYRLDKAGLIYAHAGNVDFDSIYTVGADLSAKGRMNSPLPNPFPADADGIVVMTNEQWFTNDAAERLSEFLRAVWGEKNLSENTAWLAESLGQKANETPDEAIRRYLSTQFYKDHLKTYKKRPIYWLFSSGKHKAFEALVYLHRYHEGSLARMRMEYVIPLQSRMRNQLDKLQDDINAASSTAHAKKAQKQKDTLTKQYTELLTFDEQLRHYADQRIQLDLDDGVKVNYAKFRPLLAEVKLVTDKSGGD
jgi:type II restriction/modification system DNA methylase subunit YeeA